MFIIAVSTLLLLLLLCIPPILNNGAWLYSNEDNPTDNAQTLSTRPGWQVDPLETEPGIILPGLVHPALSPSAPWILYLPGNGSTQLEGGQNYLENLVQLDQGMNDWGLAVWKMRGYNEAPGVQNGKSFRFDYQSIYQHLQSTYGVKPNRIHLIGFSFGTDMALQLASDATLVGESPASISLLSTQGMTRATWTMRRKIWYARWLPPDRYDLRSAFKLINSPVLIIEAEDDLHGSTNFLINALNKKPKYVELPGGNHTSSRSQQKALEAVRDWIRKHNNI